MSPLLNIQQFLSPSPLPGRHVQLLLRNTCPARVIWSIAQAVKFSKIKCVLLQEQFRLVGVFFNSLKTKHEKTKKIKTLF